VKAIQLREFGGPEVLQMAEVPRPVPGPGEVLLKVAASGVNFADTRLRSGSYGVLPTLPVVPGFEASGTIEELGPYAEMWAPDPSVLAIGTRVIAGDARQSYAEYAIVPADLLFKVPDGQSMLEAAGIPVNFLVAWIVLYRKAQLTARQTVLVHAAGGGVGSAAIQLAKLAGAFVVATASSDEKLALAKSLGADVTVNYSSGFRDAVRAEMGQARPIDLVVDSVGGDVLIESLELLKPWGKYVGFGQAADKPAVLDAYASAIPNQLDICFFARRSLTYSRGPEARALLRKAMTHLVDLWSNGTVHCANLNSMPLHDAAEAHRRLGARDVIGKLVLEV
jgi:NADPH2:quinone reductase